MKRMIGTWKEEYIKEPIQDLNERWKESCDKKWMTDRKILG